MKKWLYKLLMPKPADIAKTVSTAIAEFVNKSGKEEALSKFFHEAEKLQKAQALATKWLADGKFTDEEVKELQDELTPVIEEVYAKVLEKIGG